MTNVVRRFASGPATETRIDDDRLRPAKPDEEEHEQTHGIDMRARVQCEPPHELRCEIAKRHCDAGMCVLMDDHRDDEARNAGQERDEAEIKHADPPRA